MNKVWIVADYSQAEARVVARKGRITALNTWFSTGEDVHLNVAKMIGKVVQTNRIPMPTIGGHPLWGVKPWEELVKGDPERDLAKNTVHGNNYGLGAVKFSAITRLPLKHARLIQDLYHNLFPEIRKGYQQGIVDQLRKDRTLTNPLGWSRTFYDMWGEPLFQSAWAWYGQSTIGLLTIRTLTKCCTLFANDIPDVTILTPTIIRSRGIDVQMQVHDSINVVCPNDPETIHYTCKKIKEIGEYPLIIDNEPLIVPMDFAVGPTLGTTEPYKI